MVCSLYISIEIQPSLHSPIFYLPHPYYITKRRKIVSIHFFKVQIWLFFNVSLYVWLYQLIRMYKSTTFLIYSNTLECIFLLCPMVCAVLNASIILNIPYCFFKDGLLVDICCMSHKFNFSILFLKTVHLFLRHIFT